MGLPRKKSLHVLLLIYTGGPPLFAVALYGVAGHKDQTVIHSQRCKFEVATNDEAEGGKGVSEWVVLAVADLDTSLLR